MELAADCLALLDHVRQFLIYPVILLILDELADPVVVFLIGRRNGINHKGGLIGIRTEVFVYLCRKLRAKFCFSSGMMKIQALKSSPLLVEILTVPARIGLPLMLHVADCLLMFELSGRYDRCDIAKCVQVLDPLAKSFVV